MTAIFMMENDNIDNLAAALENDLSNKHGPMLFGDALLKALGYGSGDAFRHAVSRNTVPVPIFTIKHRRGKFALSKDVAFWLASQRMKNTCNAKKADEENRE